MKYYITTLRRVFAIALFSLLSPAFLVQGQVNVKFSVDVSLLIADNQFNPDIDRILLKGSFNGWADGTQLTREGTTNVYSRSVSLNANAYFTYKFFNSHSGAPNGGLENKPGFDPNGNRILQTRLLIRIVLFCLQHHNGQKPHEYNQRLHWCLPHKPTLYMSHL